MASTRGWDVFAWRGVKRAGRECGAFIRSRRREEAGTLASGERKPESGKNLASRITSGLRSPLSKSPCLLPRLCTKSGLRRNTGILACAASGRPACCVRGLQAGCPLAAQPGWLCSLAPPTFYTLSSVGGYGVISPFRKTAASRSCCQIPSAGRAPSPHLRRDRTRGSRSRPSPR